MTTTTKFALAAVAAALMGSSAMAADLGGSCCADLEERIAELEATTVRKGNRKVSVTLSGFVGHQIMFWDDGHQSDTYIGDGGNIYSRFRFRGEAKITPDVTAGFTYEFGANPNAIGNMNQLNGGDDLGGSGATGAGSDCANGSTGGCAALRDASVWMRHKRLGMVRIGQGSTATDNLVLIDLGNTGAAATPDIGLYNNAFIARRANGNLTGSAGSGLPGAAITWGNLTTGGESWDTLRRNHVLYETPSLYGFTVQAAIAEDNFWDVALRYAGEFNGVRVAFGVGYREDTEFNGAAQFAGVAPNALCTTNCDRKEKAWLGSASVLHVPTGLFLTGAYGTRDRSGGLTDTNFGAVDNRGASSDYYYLSGGLNRNFFGIGNTVIFGEYGNSDDALRIARSDAMGSNMDFWGLGVNQYIDAAAMQVFVTYKNWSGDATINTGTFAAPVASKENFKDFSAVIIGTKIDF